MNPVFNCQIGLFPIITIIVILIIRGYQYFLSNLINSIEFNLKVKQLILLLNLNLLIVNLIIKIKNLRSFLNYLFRPIVSFIVDLVFNYPTGM